MNRKRHPGYIIGNHWLETAYDRICAGEPEDEVLADFDLVRADKCSEMATAAVKAEREACAKVCEIVDETFAEYYTIGLPQICASKIRARGDK